MNGVALGLTRLWLHLLGARFLRVSVVSLSKGEEQNVVVFSSKGYFVLGQVTPFGTTIVHELVFYSERLLNYVVAHESAHKQQWYRHFIYPLSIIFLLPIVPMLSFVVITLFWAVISLEPLNLLVPIVGLTMTLILLIIPCLYSWVLELDADCHAIRELGMTSVLNAIADAHALAETHGLAKPNLKQRIIRRMTHPPISLTYRVCRFFYRRQISDATGE